MLTALIVDDEPLARSHVRRALEAQGVSVLGEAQDGAQALQLAEELRPELLLLDIQMPELTGLQVASALQSLDSPPLIVFLTAFSEHAVAAFEQGALDYLVKPVAPDRLAKMLERVQATLRNAQARHEAQQQVLDRASRVPLHRLPVRTTYAVRLIRVEEIDFAYAREKRVFVRTRDEEFPTYYRLTQLESLLPAEQFVRIHDSFLVNLDRVDQLIFLGNHTYEVRLCSKQRLPVGRTRYAELRRRLGLEPNEPSGKISAADEA
jgi:DNA-binding LytR/AlgR family response regulator